MCTVSAPPPLAPAWPWQAPVSWLVFTVVLAVVGLVCSIAIAAIRRQPSALRRRVSWALFWPGALCLIASIFLSFVVVGPANDVLLAWIPVAGHGCSIQVWQPVFNRASQTIQDVHDLGLDLLVVGFVLLLPVCVLCPVD